MNAGFPPRSSAAGDVDLAAGSPLQDFPDAVLLVDRQWRVIYSNPEAQRRLHPPEKECDILLWDLMPEAIEQARDALYRRAMNDRIAVRFEQLLPRNDTWSVVRASPHGGADGGLLIVLTDITDLKRSDDDLRDREDRYRLLFDRNPQPMFAYDTETYRFIMVNDAMISRYGYTRKQLLGMVIFDIILPEDVSRLKSLVAQIRRDPVSFSGIWKNRRQDGSIFSVEITSQGVVITGRAVRIAVAVDVTERLRAEQCLRDSEQRLRLVTDASQDGIWEWDVRTQTVYWSDRMFEMLRMKRSEFSNRRDSEMPMVHPEDRQRVASAIEAHLQRDVPYDLEIRMLRGDGSYGVFRARGKVLRDPEGKPVCMAGSIIDLTQQRQAESALRASEDLYRRLGEAMPLLMWAVRPDGSFEYANSRFTEVLGLAAKDITLDRWAQVIHPDDLPGVMERWRRQHENGNPRTDEIELRYRVADGSYRWFLSGVAPVLDDSGKLLKWVGVSTDIDDLKRTQAELRQAKDAAEAANDAKDQFLAVLSHELRTPLTPVLLTASAMRSDPGVAAETRDALGMIAEQIELEARLIDDLLDLTRIARSKFLLSMTELDGHAVVKRAIEVCMPNIEEQNLKFTAELNATQRQLHADPARLQQVLSNLLNNAAKFTPTGGQIWLRTWNEPAGEDKRVWISGYQDSAVPAGAIPSAPSSPQTLFVVEVSDTGVGIDAALLPRIFNAFEQGERSITRKFGGLGLGLTIGKTIAEMHGGTLTAASAGQNRGATLTLRLPVHQVKTASVASAVRVDSPSRRVKVLVVDDHQPTLRLMSRLLRSLGHVVSTAASAERAVEIAVADCPELLISDIGMPNQSGWSLLKELRSRCPQTMRAIAVSGYGTDDDIRRSQEAGFSDHIVKPLDVDRLKAAIERAMSASHAPLS